MRSSIPQTDDPYNEKPQSSVNRVFSILKKLPGYARNVTFSRFSYWPVGSIAGSDLHAVPTYCINLRRADVKRRLIQKQVSTLGLKNFRFIEAIDARSLDYKQVELDRRYDRQESEQYHSKGLTLNEIACSLSHRAAYEAIVSARHPVAMIIEDDALFVSRQLRRFRFSDVPADYDMVFLNSFRYREPPSGAIAGPIYDTSSYHGSAAAYLLSLEGARKLLDSSLPVIHAADGLLGRSIALGPGEVGHPFKQVGAKCSLSAYMCYPDCVLNGSICHYHVSDIRVP